MFHDDESARKEGYKGVVAPPTMVFTYAPMERGLIFNSRGFLSPEQSNPPRSTPFVGSEVFFQDTPVYAGDTVTSVTTIDRTWESKSGNRFVAFRVVGHNQRGEKVADYLYNVIWEYAKGQKGR
jgi:acyl dehydratase